jgi:hypothetical protein
MDGNNASPQDLAEALRKQQEQYALPESHWYSPMAQGVIGGAAYASDYSKYKEREVLAGRQPVSYDEWRAMMGAQQQQKIAPPRPAPQEPQY